MAIIKRLLFACLLISAFQKGYRRNKGILSGTAIIVCGSKDSLWIAADTKVNIAYGTIIAPGYKACKIHISNNIISAYAGATGTIDGKFSIVKTFEQAIQRETI